MRIALAAACLTLGCWEPPATHASSCIDEPQRGAESTPYRDSRPLPPTTCTPRGGRTQWFAFTRLLAGDVTRAGTTSALAWRDLGFDLDAVLTSKEDSKTSTGTCKRVQDSPVNVLADGNDGIDNNVGQHFIGAARAKNLPVDAFLARALDEGTFAVLLRVENFTTVDNANAPGALYLAHRVAPDRYVIDSASLEDGASIARPRVHFDGHVTRGVWATRFEPHTFAITLPMGDTRLDLNATIVAVAVRTDGTAGTIAGAIRTNELMAMTPTVNATLCGGTEELDSLLAAARTSSDVALGAPNLLDTRRICDATSFGLGFELRAVPLHDVASVGLVPSAPPRCPTATDAGTMIDVDASAD